MKTLKESILSRSSHGGDASKKRMIEEWLKEYNIKNYTINDDLTIDVNGFVFLNKENLKEFPDYIQFGVVKSYFSCYRNQLTSLRGCPREVHEYFDCSYNNLTSLEGAPREVGGLFDCSNNKLTSLKGAPKEIGGDFDCYKNDVQFTRKDVEKICNVKGVAHTGNTY